MNSEARRLIVTADDFGAADCIDQAILTAIGTGYVTATGALTNFPRARNAIASLRERFPHLDIGVHLNITSGPPLTAPRSLGSICNDRGLFLGLTRLMDQLGRVDTAAIETELRAQIEVLIDSGIQPDHLSSHHNILAIFPPLQDILTRLAREYTLPVRTPIAISQTHTRRYGYAKTRRRASLSVLGLIGRRPYSAIRLLPGTYVRMILSRRHLRKLGVATPDHLIDSLYGTATVRNIRHILRHLPAGTSELVVHLGDCNDAHELPEGIETELLTERRTERNLILNGTLRQVLIREGITLARFRDLVQSE